MPRIDGEKVRTANEVARVFDMPPETPVAASEKPRMYTVTAPDKEYCGIGAAGVHFANGRARVADGWVLDWYREHGYEVEPVEATVPDL